MFPNNDDIDIDQFLAELETRGAVPANPVARYRLLAVELAEGMSYGLWQAEIEMPGRSRPLLSELPVSRRTFIEQYFIKRWRGNPPDFSLLQVSGYLVPSTREGHFIVTPAALDLMERQLMSRIKIFISYSRDDSSAFALLLYDRFKQLGVDVFLDVISLRGGVSWPDVLKQNIQQSQHFILLIGRSTLRSQHVWREIIWAYQYQLNIIPIWHNGYHYQPNTELEQRLPAALKQLLRVLLADTHTLIVEKENPDLYDHTVQRIFRMLDIVV